MAQFMDDNMPSVIKGMGVAKFITKSGDSLSSRDGFV